MAAEAWAALNCLVTRWVRRQSFPRAWQQMRQVHIAKEETETDGLEAGAMRPIVITSILWRVVSSCIATAPQLQQWQLDILHDSQYGGIPGRRLHQAVAQLAVAFERGLPMISLDYAKCFDHVCPSVVLAVMEQAGLPRPLLGLLKNVWSQERVIELQGYVQHGTVAVHSSLPQGDSISPMALNILLAAACFHLQHAFGGDFSASVFLDDSAIAAEPGTLLRIVEVWDEWSTALGLVENLRKRAVVGKNASKLPATS